MGRDLAIDLGTANTLVYRQGEGVVLDEPAVVAVRADSGAVLAIGEEAWQLLGGESGNVLAMTIFGGLGTLVGPVIGAVAFVFLRDEFTTRFHAWQFAFGLVFVLVVLAFPSGVAGVAARWWSGWWARRS